MATHVKNSEGGLVLSVPTNGIDTTRPLDFIGAGYSGFGTVVNSNMYQLMENFAASVAPSNPAQGMTWYNKANNTLNYYDGNDWIVLGTGSTMFSALLAMMGTADNVDMTVAGSVDLHTAGTGSRVIVAGALFIPRAGAAPTGAPCSFTLEVAADTADIADKNVLSGLSDASSYAYFDLAGTNKIVEAGEVVKINIDTAAGGTLNCDIFLFGHIRT